MILPVGQIPPGIPPITTFTATFEKTGNYDYSTSYTKYASTKNYDIPQEK